MDILHFVYPFISGSASCCFHSLAITNNTGMNIHAPIFVDTCSHFSWETSRSGVDRSYGYSVFNYLRNRKTVLHSGCTTSHYCQQCTGVSISPHAHPHLLLAAFFFYSYSHPSRCEGVPHCGFDLNFPDVEHFFM